MNKTVVLFQGDSITDGNRGRTDDLNHILGHGYAFIIASKLGCELAEQGLHFVNKGISGHRLSDLHARWDEDTINIKPDILSVLIGVNDALEKLDPSVKVEDDLSDVKEHFRNSYRELLEKTKKKLPSATLVLCEPFTLKTGFVADRWDFWSSIITAYQEITRELAEEFGAVFVPLQATFTEACSRQDASYWIWDGVHPTAAGHHLLAQQWLAVVRGAGFLN